MLHILMVLFPLLFEKGALHFYFCTNYVTCLIARPCAKHQAVEIYIIHSISVFKVALDLQFGLDQ